MKNLYLIGGPMGVGKTTVCRLLKKELPAAVFLDGDWCWDADPFAVTDETKAMVQRNIAFMLNSFLGCSAYENVIFCWVMHQQAIIDTLLSALDTDGRRVHVISLTASEEQLSRRISADIARGKRDEGSLRRSLGYLPLYARLDSVKIDTTGLTRRQTAEKIARL